MDRTLSLEFARVVEAAALRSGRLLGRGQKDPRRVRTAADAERRRRHTSPCEPRAD